MLIFHFSAVVTTCDLLNSSLTAAQLDKAARTAPLQPQAYRLLLPNWGYTLGTGATMKMMAQSMPFTVLATALLIATLSCCSAENVYCVTPTATSCSSCPHNSTNCTTLSEYAQEAELYFTSNTTMVFLPGDHTLDMNITVANVTSLTMRGESSLGNVAKVVCNGSVGFLFSDMERFIIHSLAFTACSRTYTIEVLDIASLILPVLPSTQYNFSIPIKYALLLQSTQYAELVNCSFHDNLGTALVVYNTNITLSGNTEFTHNYCESTSCVGGGGIAATGSNLTFTGDAMFIGNEANFGGAGIFMINSTMNSTGSIHFIRNSISGNTTIPEIPTFCLAAGIICASASSLHFNGTSNFINNSAQSSTVRRTGAICAINNVSLSFTGTNTFINNSAQKGGAIFGYFNTSLSFTGTNNFTNNSAQYFGGAIYVHNNSALSFNGINNFINNSAWYGGAIYAYINTSLSFSRTNNFIINSAQYEGGAIRAYINTSLSFSGTNNFINNSAKYRGGAIRAYKNTSLSLSGTNNFINNSARYGGAINAYINSALHFNGTSKFTNNSAQYEGGAIDAYINISLSFSGTNHFINNSAQYNGGAITGYFNTSLSFSGTNNFINNSAHFTWGGGSGGGGAIDVSYNSTLSFTGVTNFERNSATRGGGIYASYNSVLNISGTSNFSSNSAVRGGAIFLNNNITLTFDGAIHFTGNKHNTKVEVISNGGAMFLDVTSAFIILPNTTVCWVNNQATLGGAIFVSQTEGAIFFGDSCTQMHKFAEQEDCFFQLPDQGLSSTDVQLVFINNFADGAGSVLYGGAAPNCTLLGLAYIEDDNIISRICPDTPYICPCENADLNCSIQSEITHSMYPGEIFAVSVAASSQRNGNFSAIVRARIHDNPESKIDGFQYAQEIYANTCTPLYYTVFSPSDSVMLELYGEGPCSSFSYTLNISLNQNCPPGFDISEDKSCTCEQRLQRYTNLCNISSGNITRDSRKTFWVGYNEYDGLILHPNCPFDYCVNYSVNFSLNNTDVQCAYNRSGLLCGACKVNYSLVLGTSHCRKCNNNHVALIILFAVMGVVLVFLLVICKLTMATGTLSGLVFYANIVGVNRTIFLPEKSPALSIFIAWLNLDFGIETCFYDGLDAYSQTWLQFVFPVYIWVIVGLVIAVSNYSHRFANLLGKNPVPILATLILLSYAKILRTLIAAINFTYLEYPTNSSTVWLYDEYPTYNKSVWLFDANIDYLSDKHIPLFIVAVLVFLFLFLPYTFLLLFGQWLQAISHLRFFSWVNRLKPLMDSYHAPYKAKHRYWPGLLLVLRFVLLLAFAIEFSPQQDRTSINLLSILVVAGILQLWALISGGVYRDWCLDALEGSFVLNLTILAAANTYTRSHNVNRSRENQLEVGYTSVSIALITFIGILAYHIFQQLSHTKLWKKVPKLNLKFNKLNIKLNIKQAVNILDRTEHQCEATPNNTVTHTEVSLQEMQSSVLDHPERPRNTTSTDIVTDTETDLCELRSPLDTLDTK